jgi:hypothetical protein
MVWDDEESMFRNAVRVFVTEAAGMLLCLRCTDHRAAQFTPTVHVSQDG